MKQYAYRVYKNIPNNPVIGGIVTAQDMESACQKIIERNNIQVIHDVQGYLTSHYFMMDDSKVGILIYLNPEYL